MKNPKWLREEILIALNLYFDPQRGQINPNNPKIIETSELLNKVNLKVSKTDTKKFRNPNGVSLKLSNFLAIDPNYLGVGMTSYSKLDEELFKKFQNNISGLKKEVQKIIRAEVNHP
jgi:5-methylcytosine-specific restriction protein A